jgi:protein-S-isoprenylcysteine O-methyltransferase Ste14
MKFLILLSLLFLVSELSLALVRHSKKQQIDVRRDKGSVILLWISITGGITAGFFTAAYMPLRMLPYIPELLGILIVVCGIVIRWTAIIQLKKFFTVDVAIDRDHKLIVTGLYKYVRHPSYLGLLLIITGFAFAMQSILALAVVILPVFAALIYRIRIEERTLANHFGDSWIHYKARTRMLLPGFY